MGARTLWAIHAGKTGDAESLFLSGVIGLGWDKVGDLSGAPDDRAVFKSRMAVAYPDKKEAGIPASAGQLYRFVHEVKEGERRDEQFAKLRTAQEHVLDLKHWHLFLGALLGAGFRSSELISSQTALLYSYAFYLLGKLQCRVDEHRLQRVIGRWFFASALTSRYSTSPENGDGG